MSATSTPCEMRTLPDLVTVVLHPAVVDASWSEVETFGTDVRKELENRQQPACVIDLSPLTYMGSSLVALIVRVWKIVHARGGKMVVVCGNPVVLDVIRLAGLDKVWQIAPEMDTAQRKLGMRQRGAGAALGSPISPLLSSGSLPAAKTGEKNFSVTSFAVGVVTVLIALLVTLLVVSRR